MRLGQDPGECRVFTHGAHVASLEGHVNSLDFVHADPDYVGKVYDFDQLYWTHTGAILRLQGVTIHDLLGPALVLLRAQHRPLWDPRPGARDVRILVALQNPCNLKPLEIFQLAMAEGF